VFCVRLTLLPVLFLLPPPFPGPLPPSPPLPSSELALPFGPLQPHRVDGTAVQP
ncbi:unnamed protein product, partial [Closterium sp. Naga37s-1]